jgi:hypothetical protein
VNVKSAPCLRDTQRQFEHDDWQSHVRTWCYAARCIASAPS